MIEVLYIDTEHAIDHDLDMYAITVEEILRSFEINTPSSHRIYIAALLTTNVVGGLTYSCDLVDNCLHTNIHVAVQKKHWRKGVASALVEACVSNVKDLAQDMGLSYSITARCINDKSKNMMLKCGFVVTHAWKDSWSVHMDDCHEQFHTTCMQQ